VGGRAVDRAQRLLEEEPPRPQDTPRRQAEVVTMFRGYSKKNRKLRRKRRSAKRFGLVGHSHRKARRHLFRTTTTPAYEHSIIFQGSKKAAIHLQFVRTYEKGGAFKVQACMISRDKWLRQYRTSQGPSQIGYKRKHERCNVAQGNSPTVAMKRAVVGLMRKVR
jgi:hypothetical protein